MEKKDGFIQVIKRLEKELQKERNRSSYLVEQIIDLTKLAITKEDPIKKKIEEKIEAISDKFIIKDGW